MMEINNGSRHDESVSLKEDFALATVFTILDVCLPGKTLWLCAQRTEIMQNSLKPYMQKSHVRVAGNIESMKWRARLV